MTLRFKALASLALVVAGSLALAGCSVGGLIGGSTKVPASLFTLSPEAPDPGAITRAVTAGQAVTISTPSTPKELRTVRVPVQVTPTDIQYVANLEWIDTPDKLFQAVVAETVRRTTNRVVLDPRQTSLEPGVMVAGALQRFGYDASSGQVTVVYDAELAAGSRVEARRFTASAPADGTARSVGPALNRAANQVALEVAQWIGNAG